MTISDLSVILVPVFCYAIAGSYDSSAAELPYTKLSVDVDKLLSAQIEPQNPGCAIGIIHQGKYVHKAGYGMANLEYNIPITSSTVFRTGSLSKQFTAMSIALLAEKGVLDLDADVHKYLPDLIDYGHKVTVRQMIHHIAGMADYEHAIFKKPDGSDFRFGNQDFMSIEEFYKKVAKAGLRHEPETQYLYSNLSYFLLSMVVEKVSGVTLRKFAEAEIFNKLDMSATLFYDNVNEIVPQRADGYIKLKDDSYEILMTNLSWVGGGGIFTNLDDFIAWDRNFYQNKLGAGTADLINKVTTPHPVSNGYAYGLLVSKTDDEPFIGHNGGYVGFNTLYLRYPHLELSVVAFCNSTDNNAVGLGQSVVNLYIAALKK